MTDPDALRRRADAEAAGKLAHLPPLAGQQPGGAALYRLPDGSDDWPDIYGRHTKTVNVRHSALDYARFWGCGDCRGTAEFEASSHNAGFHGHDSAAWQRKHPGVPRAHNAADCPDDYTPPDWRDGTCYCATCTERRGVLGF